MTKYHFNDFVSPSEINAFIECPSSWALRYFYGYKQVFSDAASEGLTFEQEVNLKLSSLKLASESNLTRELPENQRAAVDKVADCIVSLCNTVPEMQVKIHINDLYGVIDYATPGHLVDLKVTATTPSKLYSSHLRQLAFYQDFWHEIPSALRPTFTIFYVVFLKTKTNYVLFTSDLDLFHELGSWELEGGDTQLGKHVITSYHLICESSIERAKNENLKAIKTIARIKDNPDFIHLLPVDINHYRVNGYDEAIKQKLLSGDLMPFNSPAY